MPTATLEVHDVSKVFREGSQQVEALRAVSLRIEPGEIVALEGPSGSGKTTLLSILGCILTPSSGTVSVEGEPVDCRRPERLREVRRRSIGFVFQQYNLFPALTAAENVEYTLELKGFRRAARSQARELLERVGLSHRASFLPRDLSGGEKQRVAIARALVGAPRAILADEPTANLDSAIGLQVLALLRDLAVASGTAVVIVTHDPKVRRVATRVVGIRDGRLAPPDADERREA